ncbi:MAG TPA: TetR/AcrR family transcriptional regulator [Solimonas sp.]|nr:TetR/AcrR family transcriptional regulator [Solimonas sp.]
MSTDNRMESMGRPRLTRAEQREQRIQDLLEAARAKFIEKGYEDTTIDEVAKYAGVSHMPVYSLFGDKQNLFFELWRSTIGQLSHRLIGSAKPGQPLRHKLKALAEAVAQGTQTPTPHDPGLNLYFVVHTLAMSRQDILDKLRGATREIVADFSGFVRDATLEPGETLRGAPEAVATHILAHINGLSAAQFQTGESYLNAIELTEIFASIAIKPA